MTLIFKNSNIGCYQIVEVNGRKFVMDTSTMSPKSYYWGALSEKITVDMFELSPENTQFEIKSRTTLQTTTIALMVQPFVKIGYDMLKTVFYHYHISSQMILKLCLFILSMIISYLIIAHSLRVAHKKASERLPAETRQFQAIFRTNGHRDYTMYFFVVLHLICLLLFLFLNNGTEGAVLVINGLLALVFYISSWTMVPISASYRNQKLIPETVREI